MNSLLVVSVTLSVALVGHIAPATAAPDVVASYDTVDLPSLPGYQHTAPAAINDHGVVVGRAMWPHDEDGAIRLPEPRPVIWVAGRIRTLPIPAGVDEAVATSVNNRGVVVGEGSQGGVLPVPIRWVNGTPELLPLLPGHTTGTATGVNDLGEVIGVSARDYVSPSVPVVWRRGVPAPLPVTDQWTRGAPESINNHGTVIGWLAAYRQLGSGFVEWKRGEPPTVRTDFVDGIRSMEDINDRGVIVGAYTGYRDGERDEKALAWRGRAVRELPNPPSHLCHAVAVNLRGDVVGGAYDTERRLHPVLWRDDQPQLLPEPAGVTLGSSAVDINREGVVAGVGLTRYNDYPRELPLMWAPSS